jgi:hypothetical protein
MRWPEDCWVWPDDLFARLPVWRDGSECWWACQTKTRAETAFVQRPLKISRDGAGDPYVHVPKKLLNSLASGAALTAHINGPFVSSTRALAQVAVALAVRLAFGTRSPASSRPPAIFSDFSRQGRSLPSLAARLFSTPTARTTRQPRSP